jgi:hypothetical protein
MGPKCWNFMPLEIYEKKLSKNLDVYELYIDIMYLWSVLEYMYTFV